MHELSVAQGIAEIVEQHLPPGAVARTVNLRVGELSGVVVDSLTFCFEAITRGTRLEGAALAVERVPVTATCDDCGTAFPFSVAEPRFLCPACGGGRTRELSGRELQVVDIEVEDGT